ncbi:SGNH/GDSL hydrolase family protein, partial [Salmonella enterica subsp. enterica serovar Ajiobo]|nr:SGNH/GDSL hydrolase family protein [Salmonella enterica subsp. enterica serovar Ajiobo]
SVRVNCFISDAKPGFGGFFFTFKQKATGLIRLLSDRNENALITWILPPVMKDERKEKSLRLTRIAINRACNATNAICFDPAVVIGSEYREGAGGVMVRSGDGIHFTKKGADLIVSRLLGM